mmetsp:Transcript_3205/g.3124  ORF Transcript_3205/g.3124 Transcript_3205/m.3124 type:complete len:114 (+) Transcript_3205:296-637(+)
MAWSLLLLFCLDKLIVEIQFVNLFQVILKERKQLFHFQVLLTHQAVDFSESSLPMHMHLLLADVLLHVGEEDAVLAKLLLAAGHLDQFRVVFNENALRALALWLLAIGLKEVK